MSPIKITQYLKIHYNLKNTSDEAISVCIYKTVLLMMSCWVENASEEREQYITKQDYFLCFT